VLCHRSGSRQCPGTGNRVRGHEKRARAAAAGAREIDLGSTILIDNT